MLSNEDCGLAVFPSALIIAASEIFTQCNIQHSFPWRTNVLAYRLQVFVWNVSLHVWRSTTRNKPSLLDHFLFCGLIPIPSSSVPPKVNRATVLSQRYGRNGRAVLIKTSRLHPGGCSVPWLETHFHLILSYDKNSWCIVCGSEEKILSWGRWGGVGVASREHFPPVSLFWIVTGCIMFNLFFFFPTTEGFYGILVKRWQLVMEGTDSRRCYCTFFLYFIWSWNPAQVGCIFEKRIIWTLLDFFFSELTQKKEKTGWWFEKAPPHSFNKQCLDLWATRSQY